MEKKSIVITAIIAIILLACFLSNLTGMALQAKTTMVSSAFQTKIINAQKIAAPEEMVVIDNISIEPVILEKMVIQPEEKKRSIICFKEAAVSDAIKIVELKIPAQIAAPTKIAPPAMAIAALSSAPVSTLSFRTEVKKAELQNITIKKEAITFLATKITSIPKENVVIKKKLDNIPCMIVDTDLYGVEQMVDKNASLSVMSDVVYAQQDSEAIREANVDKTWKKQITNQSIKGNGTSIAIIDSGVDYRDKDLGGCFGTGCKISKGWNFIENSTNVMDIDGHGTHLAGIAAVVAPESSIIVLKTCQNGSCSASKIAEAIDWCLEYGCSVATLSLGDGGSHNPEECRKIETLKTVIETASSSGLAIFVSAGNNGMQWPSYPACDPNAISVGSVNDYDGQISDFSNHNPNIYAPGALIKSNWINDEYKTMIGTSQAAAFAASTAALYVQAYSLINKMTPTVQTIREQLETKGNFVYDNLTNAEYSNLDAIKLIESLMGTNPLPSFTCGNAICEFGLGEDAQNCNTDCGIKIAENITEANESEPPAEEEKKEEQIQYNLSFDIKNWAGNQRNANIEIMNSSLKMLKDFSYPDEGTDKSPIKLPDGNYSIKISHGLFSVILRSAELNSDLKLKIKIEDLAKKIMQLPGMSYAKVLATYGIGFEDNKTAVICFDKQLAGENRFVFRCPWNGTCERNWSALMNMKQREVSCIALAPGNGTAYSVVEIPEAVCGDGICEQKESSVSCPKDCQMDLKETAFGEEKGTSWKVWKTAAIIAALAVLAVLAILIVRERKKPQRTAPSVPVPPRPGY